MNETPEEIETTPRLMMRVLEADGSWGESDITTDARGLWKLGKLHPRENPEHGVEMIQLECHGAWEWDGESDEEALEHIGNALCYVIEDAVAAHRGSDLG
jgi:hypothetical protein